MEWYYYVAIAVPILIVIIGIILYVVHKTTGDEDYETQLAKAQKIWAVKGAPLMDQYNDIVFDKKGKQVYKGLNPKERPLPKDGEPLLDQYDNPVFNRSKQQIFFKARKPQAAPLSTQVAVPLQPPPVAVPLQPPIMPAAVPLQPPMPVPPQMSLQPMMMPNYGNSYPFPQQQFQLPPGLTMSIS